MKKVKKSVNCRVFVRKGFIPLEKNIMMDNGGTEKTRGEVLYTPDEQLQHLQQYFFELVDIEDGRPSDGWGSPYTIKHSK